MSNDSGIQSGGQGGGGGNFPTVQKGKDFFDYLPHCRDDGERIQLFLETAERPDVPLKALEELLKYRDQFYLTMGLQSFAYIGNQTIRTKLANLDYIDGLDEPLDEIYQRPNPEDYKCHSQRIFEKLSQEAQSGSELTRLSAAWTIQQLKYSPMNSGKFLFKSAEDIQRQIISENLKRLNDRYLFNDSIRYKEFIDFWVYAPKNHLLQLLQSIPANSLNIVESILARLGVPGVEFVTRAYGLQKFILEAGLRSADSLFRDTRYQDSQTRERLSKVLIPFLDNTDIEFRRFAAKTINEAGSWLKAEVRGKAAVISRDWNGNVVGLGEVSVPFLLQALRGSLILDTKDNLGEQLKAIQCIGTIYAANLDKKIINLVEFLQHCEESIRSATVSLLKQHKDRLDQNSLYILTALDFQFCSLTADFNYSIVQVEKEIISTRQYQKEIERIFQNAILSCNKENATEVSKFLSSKQKEYDRLLCKHIESLEDYKSSLEREAVEKIEEKRREKVRFVIDCVACCVACVTFVAFLPFLPLVANAMYAMYRWWNEQSNIKYFLFFADITVKISLFILIVISFLDVFVSAVTAGGDKAAFMEISQPVAEALVYGIVGSILYRLLFNTPIVENVLNVVENVLNWIYQEIIFMFGFIIKKLRD
jgi:hypothetical protein